MIRPLVIGNAAFHAVQALWDERHERATGSGPSAAEDGRLSALSAVHPRDR